MRTLVLVVLGTFTGSAVFAQSLGKPVRDSLAAPAISFRLAGLQNSQPSFQLTKDAAAKHLPFFCEQERRWDKTLPMPLRFRLGSQEQADWLERKPAAIRPQ